nr:hypothetical protein [Tanacetum cinerariifolium]
TGGYLALVGYGTVGGIWRLGPNGHIHEHVPSSVVSTKCWCVLLFILSFSFFLLFGYPPFESFAMSLEESDDLNIPDAAPVDPVLEAGALPKFDMHLYKSSLNESDVRYLAKLYGILEELRSRVASKGKAMNDLPLGAIGLYAHHFQQGGLQKHADRAFSIKDSKGKVITMAKFLRLPNFKGCKVSAETLLPPGTTRVTHLAPLTGRLEDILPKTGDMIVAEMPCRKVLDDKEKKKRKAEEKAAARDPLANGNADASHAIEGHGNNEGGLSGIQTRPSPGHHSGRRLDTLEEPVPTNIVPDLEASYSVSRFGNLPFTPQRGLTKSSRMDNSRECHDIMANLFTPADEEFFLEGVQDESAIRRSWKLLCQSAQQQGNTLLRFEELAVVQSAYNEKVSAFDQLSKNYDGALLQEKGFQDRLEELEEEKRESTEYKRSLGEVFSLAIGKGFMDGISIGREDADVRAILQATPNVDPASSNIFMDAYEKLFD